MKSRNRTDYDETKSYEEAIAEVKEEPKKKEKKPTKIIVTINNLALRDAPNGNKIGIVSMGFNSVVDVVSVNGEEWGELEDGSGYINMNWTRKA